MKGIVLDTNVISEPRNPIADPNVRAWFEAQTVESLYLTATVVGELAVGVERLPPGRRRSDFEDWLRALVEEHFSGRVLAFDAAAALIFGKLVGDATARGRRPAVGDAQIAAVARRDGLAVATRDVTAFEALGATIVDPWRGP
jgi:toxin FitB